ncbi:hypothetical protein N7474_007287 [Penicillium riverlandense]|uniref:uncharacterized protein n=1 Tax=Penicillium riverlandense TaxID=1903569 RepID=UPI0025486035|nr:uncharacterized protein N7474_007287 [Penicillium riverlandense]KAJ5815510.1 hypothetical protein N7474_007287 [Penicillium riverlandense]
MVHIQDLPTELLENILSFIAEPDDYKSAAGREDTVNKLQRELPRDLQRDDWDDDDYDDDDDDEDEDEDEDEDDDEDMEKEDDDHHEHECLRNICLVSQRFRALAQPRLFRYFEEDGWQGGIVKTMTFAKILYGRPELGKHVQMISITPLVPEPGKDSPRRLPEDDFQFFTGVIQGLDLADQEKQVWIPAAKKGSVGVFVALLAHQTPNLRALHLPGEGFFLQPLTRLFSHYPSFLSNLESVHIESDVEEYVKGYNIANYKHFLTLPKLTFPTFEYGDLVDASFPSTWAPGTLATEQVAFHHCHLDAGAIKKFMQACKTLRSFTYQNFSMNPDHVVVHTIKQRATSEFNAAQAHEAALLHKDTLEHFHVEFYRDIGAFETIERVQAYMSSRPKIGSFRDFAVLDTIILPHAVLPPHPQFPPSLKMLRITDCNSSIRDLVQNIAEDVQKGLYPALREFRILAIDVTKPIKLPGQRIPPGKTPEQCFRSLHDLFQGTKVDFMISPYEMSDFLDDLDDNIEYGLDPEHEYGLYGPGAPGGRGAPGCQVFSIWLCSALCRIRTLRTFVRMLSGDPWN